MTPDDYDAPEGGLSNTEMRADSDDHGISAARTWSLFPIGRTGERGAERAALEDRMYPMAEVFGTRHIKLSWR